MQYILFLFAFFVIYGLGTYTQKNNKEVLSMSELTIATFFTSVTGVVSGLVSGAAAFVADLWGANVIGQIMITLGIASAIIGLGYKLFLRKKHI